WGADGRPAGLHRPPAPAPGHRADDQGGVHRLQPPVTAPASVRWWAPDRAVWWAAALFMVGSACFAVGAVPAYLDLVGVEADGVTFFVGSLFFTSAAGLQLW